MLGYSPGLIFTDIFSQKVTNCDQGYNNWGSNIFKPQQACRRLDAEQPASSEDRFDFITIITITTTKRWIRVHQGGFSTSCLVFLKQLQK